VIAAPARTATTEAPKLLLDTNIYLDLVDGRLTRAEAQLLKLAAQRTPPLFWACEVTLDELVCRMRPGNRAHFDRNRSALRWMDDLCGVLGTAEETKWIMLRGVFAAAVPSNGRRASTFVRVRRAIQRTNSYEELPPAFQSKINELRAQYSERIDRWVEGRRVVGEAARAKVQPGDRGVRAEVAAADVVLEISRKHAADYAPIWGAFRSEEDQKRAQRELIAFEVSYLQKARGPEGYNHDKHRSDFNDYWLCAYCAAGYTVVTNDERLRSMVRDGGCDNPRLISLDEAIAVAEAWLAGR
jgi:predicted nucleic acid-binding protein